MVTVSKTLSSRAGGVMGLATIACAAALSAILLRAAWEDLRAREIPNALPLAIMMLAPVWWWAGGAGHWPALAWQAAVAALMFALLCGAWLMGLMGGGDVKLLAALALWFAPMPLLGMLAVMGIAGGAVTLGTLVHHRVRASASAPEVPYGVAIAFAGIWAMAHEMLTIPVR